MVFFGFESVRGYSVAVGGFDLRFSFFFITSLTHIKVLFRVKDFSGFQRCSVVLCSLRGVLWFSSIFVFCLSTFVFFMSLAHVKVPCRVVVSLVLNGSPWFSSVLVFDHAFLLFVSLTYLAHFKLPFRVVVFFGFKWI